MPQTWAERFSKKECKKMLAMQQQVLQKEQFYQQMTDEALQAQTVHLKALLETQTLDDILPDAFAVCREAAKRVLGMQHYPVQILGGIVLHKGYIAEMKTGEGKTLMETLPVYLNALTGRGVDVITVNEYLAQRDSQQMGKLYTWLGLSVGLIASEQFILKKKSAYCSDITYGTNSEFGFDYLRDNCAQSTIQQVQCKHAYAIIDEIDSILIDEASTPLILSQGNYQISSLGKQADDFVRTLKKAVLLELALEQEIDLLVQGDYVIDEKNKVSMLTKSGIEKAEQYFEIENLAAQENAEIQYYIERALSAHGIMKRDVDYIVKDNKVMIVDTFTGRLQPSRRYKDGLHQALELKEGVVLTSENKTKASTTYPHYFRRYEKIAGMTGTAMTQADEFFEIYGLNIVEVPTNKPNIRVDYPDVFLPTETEKFHVIAKKVLECHQKGQPVLIGTPNVEQSEVFATVLKEYVPSFYLLNAKNHAEEARIIAKAGKKGAVTIATNMAGRGTDILLGGVPEDFVASEMEREGAQVIALHQKLLAQEEQTIETLLLEKEGYAQLEDEIKEFIEEVKSDTTPTTVAMLYLRDLYQQKYKKYQGIRTHQEKAIERLQGTPNLLYSVEYDTFIFTELDVVNLQERVIRLLAETSLKKMCQDENAQISEQELALVMAEVDTDAPTDNAEIISLQRSKKRLTEEYQAKIDAQCALFRQANETGQIFMHWKAETDKNCFCCVATPEQLATAYLSICVKAYWKILQDNAALNAEQTRGEKPFFDYEKWKEPALNALPNRACRLNDETGVNIRFLEVPLIAVYQEKIARYKKEKAGEVRALGGLFVIGTQRNLSRRIDLQLSGRAGRQGDPGASQFFLSPEDLLIHLRQTKKMQKLWLQDTIQSNARLEKEVQTCQNNLDQMYFAQRKNQLVYDDVFYQQQMAFYQQRQMLLEKTGVEESMQYVLHQYVNAICDLHLVEEDTDTWNATMLQQHFQEFLPDEEPLLDASQWKFVPREKIVQDIIHAIARKMERSIGFVDAKEREKILSRIMQRHLTREWDAHFEQIAQLQKQIVLYQFAQKNIKNEYRIQAHALFETMIKKVQWNSAEDFMRIRAVEKSINIETEDGMQTVLKYDYILENKKE